MAIGKALANSGLAPDEILINQIVIRRLHSGM